MIEFLFIKYLDRKIINGIMVKSVNLDYMERCPSGLRCMIGNHVAGEYRHGGSNPPLSAIFYFTRLYLSINAHLIKGFFCTLIICIIKTSVTLIFFTIHLTKENYGLYTHLSSMCYQATSFSQCH